MALVVGTGVAYLSAEPCPLKAWVGVDAYGNNPLKSGVADSGGPSLIEESLVPPEFNYNLEVISQSHIPWHWMQYYWNEEICFIAHSIPQYSSSQ